MARLTSELILSLSDRVSGPARGVGTALDRLEKKQRGFGKTSRSTALETAAMSRAAPMMLAGAAGAAAPIAAALGGKAVVTAAADFESALTNIQKKAGTTAAQTAQLGEEIKALATSGDLAVPIEEISATFERGAAAGIPIGDLKEFAALSVKAADGFEMSAEEVGNFAAKLKTGMGMTNDQVRRVFDLTNSLADAGIADESAIVDYMDRVGASLKTLGMTAEQSLALGSTMLNLGMTSEVAATGTDALANKLLTVSRLTGGKRKTFEKYMGSVDKFADLVDKDANGALQTMLEKLRSLDSRDRMAFLTDFVGQEHAGKILRIAEALDELRRNNELAADSSKWFGSLDTAYKLKLDDFWSQWQLVKNALAKLTIDTGTMGMPMFKAALEGALALVAETDAGLQNFKAKVDTQELEAALGTIRELGTAIGELMQLGGGGSPIMTFFDRLAASANLVSSGIGVAKDVLQAVGVVDEDDDKAADRKKRRDTLLDSYKTLNPKIGGAIEGYRNWANEDAPNRNARAEEERARSMDDFLGGTGLPTEQRSQPAEKGGRVSATGRAQASVDALAAQLREQAARMGSAPPASVPTPTVRPNIEAPIKAESENAAQAAEAAGRRISDAFSITVAPTIDPSSILATDRAAAQLESRLARIAGQQAAIRRGASSMAAGGGEDFSGIYADIED